MNRGLAEYGICLAVRPTLKKLCITISLCSCTLSLEGRRVLLRSQVAG